MSVIGPASDLGSHYLLLEKSKPNVKINVGLALYLKHGYSFYQQ
jgi:hypothetical protein